MGLVEVEESQTPPFLVPLWVFLMPSLLLSYVLWELYPLVVGLWSEQIPLLMMVALLNQDL